MTGFTKAKITSNLLIEENNLVFGTSIVGDLKTMPHFLLFTSYIVFKIQNTIEEGRNMLFSVLFKSVCKRMYVNGIPFVQNKYTAKQNNKRIYIKHDRYTYNIKLLTAFIITACL